MFRSTLLGAVLSMGVWVSFAAGDMGDSELGRSIFEKGLGRDGREIIGRIHGTVVMRGQAVACMSCHGLDARGGGEAFIRAPDIRWHTLSKPFAPRRLGGSRPAYDHSMFARAIHHGIASNDAALDPAMPRFDLSQDETEALIRYLTRTTELESSDAVSTKVALGLLPFPNSSRFSRELTDRLTSCSSTARADKFPPIEFIYYENSTDALSKMKARISDGGVLYILAPYIAGWETQYFNASRNWPVRSLVPVTALDLPAHPMITFALPGLLSQVGALLDRGFTRSSSALTVVISKEEVPTQELLNFVRDESRRSHIRLNEVILERSDSLDRGAPWLILSPLEQVSKKLRSIKPRANLTALVPAMFFDPQSAERIERRLPGIVWKIAYPYPPVEAQTGRWRNPADAWAEAGCALMAMMEENQDWVSSHASVTLENGMTLLSTNDDRRRRDHVIVEKWEPHKARR
jgi:hypothetical protein